MTPRDPDRMIRAFLAEGSERLGDPVYDAVRAEIDTKPQRVVIGPWRMPAVNKIVPLAVGAAAVAVVLVVGAQVLRPPDQGPASDAGAATPSPSAPAVTSEPTPTSTQAASLPDGTVRFQDDGRPVTTVLDVAADGAAISGTAVTTFSTGDHTVRLECAARDGDTWAVAGTTEATAVSGERAGDWSAVVVKDGSPQRVGIWVSDPKTAGTDCAGWLAGIDLSTIGVENFHPVEAGRLVPPPAEGGPGGGPGGTVHFQGDNGPATTAVDLVVDGATVSGTAVTAFGAGKVHTVQLECADRDGDTWTLGGTTAETSFPGERTGDWSAVVVRDGSPQQIGIWLSDSKTQGADCIDWLDGIDAADVDADNFKPVEAGLLVAPPNIAP